MTIIGFASEGRGASRAARTRGTLITRIALRAEPRGIADLSLPTSKLGTVAIMLIGVKSVTGLNGSLG